MDDMNLVIQTIAKRHGVVLNKEDPILMLHTYMECFQESLNKQQEEERHKLVSAMELEQQKWTAESKARAERILSASLEEAHKTATAVCEQAGAALMTRITNAMAEKLDVLERKEVTLYRLAMANMLGAGLLVVAALLIWASQ